MSEQHTIVTLMIFMAISLTLVVPFSILLGFILRNLHLRHIKEKQELEHNYQQEILHTQLEIQQQTLEMVSQEIHDNIGQHLSIVKIYLNTIEELQPENPYQQKLAAANELVSRVIEDLRHLAKGVNPQFVQEHGLAGCIRFELERLEYLGVFKTTFIITGTACTFDLSKEFVLYRIIQENLNNIIRHARAAQVSIELAYETEHFTCRIVDDGRGFDVDKALQADIQRNGSGLRNMCRRMELIGGAIYFKSKIGGGTSVKLVLTDPYNT